MLPEKPKNSHFTDEQWQAIHLESSDIIVSAGAGSGKTSVLTERVIHHLLKGHPITSLLILTFTKAAALEMKVRIRKALKKEIENGQTILKDELERLDAAHINTFDGYCLYLVKTYNSVLGISKQIEIGDPIIFDIAKSTIMEDLFDRRFKDHDPDFEAYLKTYTTKNSKLLAEQVTVLNDLLMKENLGDGFFSTYSDTYETEDYLEMVLNDQSDELNRLQIALNKALLEMMDADTESPEAKTTKDLWMTLVGAHSKALSYDDFHEAISKKTSLTFARKILDSDKEILKPYRERIKATLEAMEQICYQSKEDNARALRSIRPHIHTLLDLTKSFRDQYRRYQDQHHIYDFQTIQMLSIKILKEHPSIQKEVKASFHEILVDEYQDTSTLQNDLIDAISNNNVFMVGDIKQSIYGFRDAVPKLFLDKYHAYERHDHPGTKIDLTKNFRSRKSIIDGLNALFSVTMDTHVGGVTYDDSQALSYGNKAYDVHALSDAQYGLSLYRINDPDILGQHQMHMKTTGGSLRELRSEDMHAQVIAHDILTKINQGFMVFDKDLGELRPCQFDDFVILVDRKKEFTNYKNIFESHQIPLYPHSDRPFIENDDIMVMKSLLQLLECYMDQTYANIHFRHAFASLFRSFLFNLEDEVIVKALLKIHTKRLDVIHDAKAFDHPVIDRALDTLKAIAKDAATEPIDRIMTRLVLAFDIIERAIALGQTEAVEQRILYLIKKAASLSHLNYHLSDLLDYFDHIIDHNLDIEYSGGSKLQKGMCNIMTIHKSKGLEFPVVYYPMLFLKWHKNKSQNIYFDRRYGIIIKAFEEGLVDTSPKHLMHLKAHREHVSEHLRLLYVALTRAREMAIVILSSPEEGRISHAIRHDVLDLEQRESYACFQDILDSVFGNINAHHQTIPYDPQIFNTNHMTTQKKIVLPDHDSGSLSYHELKAFEKVTKTARYSASGLTRLSAHDLKMMRLGTRLHHILELIDFKQDVTEEIHRYASSFEEASMLMPIVSWPMIAHAQSGKVYKEFEFATQEGDTFKHGVIDLLIETEDTFYLIDYKLHETDKDSYMKQVRGYMGYIASLSDKHVKGYLYSILKQDLIEVMMTSSSSD